MNSSVQPGISSAAGGVRAVTLEDAIVMAADAHRGQVDKAGAPYILHPLRVMARLTTEDERIVGVMHDVLEDCPDWDDIRLREMGFSDVQVIALFALTRRPHESYDEFIQRVALNQLALNVKLADLADNMVMERLPEITEVDVQRYKKYRNAHTRLLFARLGAKAIEDTTEPQVSPGIDPK